MNKAIESIDTEIDHTAAALERIKNNDIATLYQFGYGPCDHVQAIRDMQLTIGRLKAYRGALNRA